MSELTIADIPLIQAKINDAKDRRSRAQGAQERILADWKAEGINSIDEATAEINKLQQAQDRDQLRLDELMKELGEAADWGSL